MSAPRFAVCEAGKDVFIVLHWSVFSVAEEWESSGLRKTMRWSETWP